MLKSAALCSAAAMALAVCGGVSLIAASPAFAQYDAQYDGQYNGVSVYAPEPPPPLPVYDQPQIPDDGYIWVPGYWAWDQDYGDYYWVPGAWVEPPEPGLLWTPGYWTLDNDQYGFIPGYWATQVGWYGGVDYGFGYDGYGYGGGYWQGGRLYYNREANNLGGRSRYVFDRPVQRFDHPRPSFNGRGGVSARPTAAQLAGAGGRHIPATSEQRSQMGLAARQPDLRASANHGRPTIAATPRAGDFSGPGVVRGGGSAPPPAGVYHQEFGPQSASRRGPQQVSPPTGSQPSGGYQRPAGGFGHTASPPPQPQMRTASPPPQPQMRAPPAAAPRPAPPANRAPPPEKDKRHPPQ
ncbi:MAG TPA: hypothetical protein VG248_18040 [Caulobacteraceae bacterium]|jgi:hypothetical protein|nr:hypothetical protein [Caulobacteraceae bacterium]